jgi:hypothetical protein
MGEMNPDAQAILLLMVLGENCKKRPFEGVLTWVSEEFFIERCLFQVYNSSRICIFCGFGVL